MGHREPDWLSLVRDDICLLGTSWCRVNGEETEAMVETVDTGAADDEWLRVILVLDLADVGRAVSVREAEGLQVVGVETATADGESEEAGVALALFDRCTVCCSCEAESGGAEEGEEHCGDVAKCCFGCLGRCEMSAYVYIKVSQRHRHSYMSAKCRHQVRWWRGIRG